MSDSRRQIDPKIIDDSSDEDSDSDEDDQNLPIGPALPPPLPTASASTSIPPPPSSSPSSPHHQHHTNPHHHHTSSNDTDAPPGDFPYALTHDARLGNKHTSRVTTLSLEPSANRLMSASVDGTVKLWDFNSMDRSLLSFRQVSPMSDAGSLLTTSFSPSGSRILFGGDDGVVVMTDRDVINTFAATPRGDMYLVDVTRTAGHTASVTATLWTSHETFLSCSHDGTIRTWDLNRYTKGGGGGSRSRKGNQILHQQSVFKIRPSAFIASKRASKIRVLSADFIPPGSSISTSSSSSSNNNNSSKARHDGSNVVVAVACDDGVVRIVDTRSRTGLALSSIPYGTLSSSSVDNSMASLASCTKSTCPPLISLRVSNALHVLDMRKLKSTQPIYSYEGLYSTTSDSTSVVVVHSPSSSSSSSIDEPFAITSNSSIRGSTNTQLCALSLRTGIKLKCVFEMNDNDDDNNNNNNNKSKITAMTWHEGIGQLLIGTTTGSVHVRYDEMMSKHGVLQCLSRQHVKKSHGFASIGVGPVLTGAEVFANRHRLHSVLNGDVDASNTTSTTTGATKQMKRLKRWQQQQQDAENKREQQPKPLRPPPPPSATLRRQRNDNDDNDNDNKSDKKKTKISTPSMTRYVDAQNVSDEWSRDPRQALLRYADAANKNPVFTRIYNKTQPNQILAQKTAEQEEEESRQAVFQRDRVAQQQKKQSNK